VNSGLPDLNPELRPRASLTLITNDRTMVLESYEEALTKHEEAGIEGTCEFQTFRDFAREIDRVDHEPFRRMIPQRYIICIDEITDRLWERHQERLIEEAKRQAEVAEAVGPMGMVPGGLAFRVPLDP